MKERYEPIRFDSWQELAKYVIDGGEVYIKNNACIYAKLEFDGRCFNYSLNSWIEDTYIKKQPTLEELIAIKPRLCWVWDYEHQQSMKILAVVDHSGEYPGGFRFQSINGVRWKNAQMLTDDEIKQFLSGE